MIFDVHQENQRLLDTTKEGSPVPRGAITLLDGTEIRVKLVAPRAKKEKAA